MHKRKIIIYLLILVFFFTSLPLSIGNVWAAGANLDNVLNVPGGNLRFDNATSRPWIIDNVSYPGRTTASSNIAGIKNGATHFNLNAGILTADKVLSFDWRVSSEPDKDILYFIVNGAPVANISGHMGEWETFEYVIPSTGAYTFRWLYQKDYIFDSGTDSAWIDNVRISDYVHVDAVVVSPISIDMHIGFTHQFTAQTLPANATDKTITWQSTDPAVASVDKNGLVTAKSEGLAYITATAKDGGIVGEGRVNVLEPIETTGISLDITNAKLLKGDTGVITATIFPELASYRDISWYTSDNNIAPLTVENDITKVKVLGKNPGTAVITAVTETGNFTASCNIKVLAEEEVTPLQNFTFDQIEKDTITPITFAWPTYSYVRYERPPQMVATVAKGFKIDLEEGEKITLETSGQQNVDTYLDIFDSDFNRIAFDDDSSTASFSLIEDFLAPQNGTYYILVSGYDTGNYSKGSFDLHIRSVEPIPVIGVAFDYDSFTVPLDHTLPLSYSILPGNADFKGVSFSSNNPQSIAVNQAGEVTGLAPGTSIITVTTDKGGYTDTCQVTVGYTAVESFSFDKDAVILGLNSAPKTLLYTILPFDAQLRGVDLVSSDPSVVEINAQGELVAKSLGTAVITATTQDRGLTDTCSVRVMQENISEMAQVTLIAGDVWEDGTGYQLLLDADADTYGRLFQKTGPLNDSGNASQEIYDEFEYKIPHNADGVLTTSNIVVNNSISILIPEGVYDYAIANPVPGAKVWIADTNANSPGRYNNYYFQAGYSYTFTMTHNNSPIPSFRRDVTTLTVAYTGAGMADHEVSFRVEGSGGSLTGKTDLLVDEGYVLTQADIPVPTPAEGYRFVGWNAQPLGKEVNAPLEFVATFEINTYTVIFKDWNGSILGVDENVPHGSAATPPAEPNSRPNWHFVGWNPSPDNISGNITITAQYAINTYNIDLPTGPGFEITLAGYTVNPTPHGSIFTFSLALDPLYSQSVITVKAGGNKLTPAQGVYKIENVTGPVTVTVEGVQPNPANFSQLDAALTLALAVNPDPYKPATYAALEAAIAQAEAIDRDTATALDQEDIDAALEALNSALDGLEEEPDSFTLIDGSDYQIGHIDEILSDLNPEENTLEEILAQFENSPERVKALDSTGKEITPNDKVGTGAHLDLLDIDGQVIDSLDIVLHGDTDGDGLIDGLDAVIVSMLIDGMLTKEQVGELFYEAADANKDGIIDELDFELLEKAGLLM
ncbi:MAG: DUF2436 domain-containing protein [Clostridiales bacterium]|nr:DUF2436 domain-containing protein [Clostridiales bacterium]